MTVTTPELTPTSLESVYMQMIRLLPRNLVSRGMGRASDIVIPRGLRKTIYRRFAAQVGANLDEVELPLQEYPSLNAFFTRRLREGVRTWHEGQRLISSPVDGRVSEFGPIVDGLMTQIKGRTYSLEDLLVDPREAEPFQGGWYCTIYLSPKDYHRIHFPVPGRILGYRYVPGHLFPVNPPSVKTVDKLFCVNERVVTFQDAFVDREGGEPANMSYRGVPLATILVGATCVGRMSLAYDDLETNTRGSHSTQAFYADHDKYAARGDELGRFNLGSTIIMLVGAGVDPVDELVRGEPIQLGTPVGNIRS